MTAQSQISLTAVAERPDYTSIVLQARPATHHSLCLLFALAKANHSLSLPGSRGLLHQYWGVSLSCMTASNTRNVASRYFATYPSPGGRF